MLTVTGNFFTGINPSMKNVTRTNVLSGHTEQISGAEAVRIFGPGIAAKIAAESGNFLTSGSPLHSLAPYNCRITGTMPPQPPDHYHDFEKIKSNNGSAWKARLRTGEIIVSPYRALGIHSSYAHGQTVEVTGSQQFLGKAARELGIWTPDPKINNAIIVDGWRYTALTIPIMYYRSRTVSVGPSPFDYGWNQECFDDCVNTWVSSLSKDDGTIVTTLAEANSRTIDVLTAMAEMPETVRSIIDGVKTCMKMYAEAKTKSFRLYNKAKGNSGKATAVKNSKEAADAVANVWLNFRYNIMPNVFLIEDTMELLSKEFEQYLRTRSTLSSAPTFECDCNPLWSHKFEGTVTERCLIKRRVSVSGQRYKNMISDMLANAVITGYELIPLSFVLDWFIQVGDFLMAFFTYPDFRQEGSTYSWKCDGAIVSTGPNNVKVVSEVSFYRRDVINPRATVFIPFRPDISGYRTLDAVALSWSIFKDDFFRLLHRK